MQPSPPPRPSVRLTMNAADSSARVTLGRRGGGKSEKRPSSASSLLPGALRSWQPDTVSSRRRGDGGAEAECRVSHPALGALSEACQPPPRSSLPLAVMLGERCVCERGRESERKDCLRVRHCERRVARSALRWPGRRAQPSSEERIGLQTAGGIIQSERCAGAQTRPLRILKTSVLL